VYDGAEIAESIFTLKHISIRGGAYQCYAPDKPQMHVVDHTKGAPAEESRNAMVEASRICRGDIKPLTDLKPSDVDAVPRAEHTHPQSR